MSKGGRSDLIEITLKLPFEVAEYLAIHGEDALAAIRMAVSRHQSQPKADGPDPKELAQERLNRLERIGRAAYRILRERMAVAAYFTANGTFRAPKNQDRQLWEKQVLRDIAAEIGEPFEVVELAVIRFRKELKAKVREWRRKVVVRMVLNGTPNEEIAKRIGQHKNTVSRIVQANLDEIKGRARNNPPISAPNRKKAKPPSQPISLKSTAKKGTGRGT